MSPPLPMRDRSPSDTANSQFPLNNLDYESNPAAVAQELSNLQALRRMSMDVNATGDPDLPAFSSGFSVPTIAPTGDADEDDTSRLFWVPARLHPELAPKEFKTFLDNRVESIKRRSGDSSLSPGDPQRHGSGGGLRRKKSMLSRQIDNSGGRGAEGYTDGAERLDRKRSLSGQEVLNTGFSNLQDLEVLVNDPAQAIQRLSLDTSQNAVGGEVPADEDMPILPAAPPGGNSLRRSTRTAYRRGSLRKGERVPFSKRAAKAAETDTGDSPTVSSSVVPADDFFSLHRGTSLIQYHQPQQRYHQRCQPRTSRDLRDPTEHEHYHRGRLQQHCSTRCRNMSSIRKAAIDLAVPRCPSLLYPKLPPMDVRACRFLVWPNQPRRLWRHLRLQMEQRNLPTPSHLKSTYQNECRHTSHLQPYRLNCP